MLHGSDPTTTDEPSRAFQDALLWLDGLSHVCLLPAGRAPFLTWHCSGSPAGKLRLSYLGRGWCPQSSRGWWSGCCSRWSTEASPGCSSGCQAGGPETGPGPVPHKPPSPLQAAGGRRETDEPPGPRVPCLIPPEPFCTPRPVGASTGLLFCSRDHHCLWAQGAANLLGPYPGSRKF